MMSPIKPLPQPEKPAWRYALDKAIDECQTADVPYVLVAVSGDGGVVGGYDGTPDIIRQLMVMVAQRFEADMARRRNMASLVAPNGEPGDNGREVRAQ